MGGSNAQYGAQDGFVCKVAGDGKQVFFCSYFGTNDIRIIRDLAVDQSGNIYLASAYSSGSYPAAVAQKFKNSPLGNDDGVVAKIAPDGSQVLWARYLGGSGTENNTNSVGVDAAGNVYFLCTTESSNAPTPNGAQRSYGGGNGDLYLVRLSPADGSIVWGTYLGGSSNESTETHELGVGPAGDVYVGAPTTSADFPTTAGAFQRQHKGGTNDMFVAHYDRDGHLLASTLVGGAGADRPEGVSVDQNGYVHLTGSSTSSDFPLTEGAIQNKRGPRDAVVVVLPPDLKTLLSSSFVGSSDEDYGRGATVGVNGVTIIGGETASTDWPGAAAPPRDGFVVRFTGTRNHSP
jgi:hypothetical protein